MQNVKITSLKELQLQMPQLLKQFGANQELTTIALANPLLALEKAGVAISAEARKEIELHIRFGKNKSSEVIKLQKEIEETAGKNFDPYNKEMVAALLLKSTDKTDSTAVVAKKAKAVILPTTEKLLSILDQQPLMKNNKLEDPLSEYAHLHPAVPLLIKLRALDAVYPRFASEADTATIQKTIKNSPLGKVTFRLSRK